MSTYSRISAMEKGIEIIKFLAEQRGPVSGRDVAMALDMKHGTVMCYLATCQDHNWVNRVGDHYEVGQGLASIWARKVAKLKSARNTINYQLEDLEG
ncbi:hypothetical protein DSCO28_07690 [Desulfosarcina ovata subsp. sediminis]|uniref:HTH iclR-type domain-containing protein n=1 Tax=Desulfosarcina ovata subsp. sediminis TaxID=885957 RepID=A0A5K7ZQY9_9BACT|nr:helix-turn-helix domain-containing protein [Desulfosarcina ovata]BBO80203.1 hypothetical protein DSCO28_07690 [Desulfosarcina ovata subsp. sediminis]